MALFCAATIINIIICEFSPLALADGFYWSLSDSKSSQIFRTLRSILAAVNNAIIWMASVHLPISNSSSPLRKPLGTFLSTPITIVITVTFIFQSFFFVSGKVQFLPLLLFILSFEFYFFFWELEVAEVCGSIASRRLVGRWSRDYHMCRLVFRCFFSRQRCFQIWGKRRWMWSSRWRLEFMLERRKVAKQI